MLGNPNDELTIQPDLAQVFRQAQCSLYFLAQYPSNLDIESKSSHAHLCVIVRFLSISLLVLLARDAATRTEQVRLYRDLQTHAQAFTTSHKTWLSLDDQPNFNDYNKESSSVLVFYFEASTRLQDWSTCQRLAQESQSFQSPELQSVLGDLTLSSTAPNSILVSLLEQTVNNTFCIQTFDVALLSRWIRCLFRLTQSSMLDAAETLLYRAIILATAHKEVYPPEEVEWLAVSAFNRATDFFVAEQDENCERWAQTVLKIAPLVEVRVKEEIERKVREMRREMSCNSGPSL